MVRMIFAFRLATYLLFAAIAVMTLGPLSLRPHTPLSPDFDRFSAYAVLGVLFALSYPRRRLWVMAAVLVFAAGAFEMGQLLVPHRDAHLGDFLFKAGGAVIGLFAGRLVRPLLPPGRSRFGG